MTDGSFDDLANALQASPNFVNPAYSTPQQRQQLYAYAQEMLHPTPVANWAQGFGSLARALVGGNAQYMADQQEQASRALNQKQLTDAAGAAYSPPVAPAGAPGAAGPQSSIAPTEQEAYIRQAAQQRGIDPDTAVRVARSEGLGASAYAGDQNSSFGPFQLHYGGVASGGNATPGMGDDFTKQTGLDARDPSTWKAQTDFALDNAAKNGWGAWHGARAVGIADNQGIGGAPQGRTQLAGPVPTPDSAPAPAAQVAQGAPQAPIQAGPRSALPVSAAAIGAVLANPNIDPGIKHQLLDTIAPKAMTDALGNTSVSYQNQAPAAPIFHGGVLSHVGPTGEIPTVLGGSGQNPTNSVAVPTVRGAAPSVPAAGTDDVGSAILGPHSAVGSIIQQNQENAARAEELGQSVHALANYKDQGVKAAGALGQLGSVEELGKKAGYGVIPSVQKVLGEYGMATPGLTDIQAYNSAIDALAPNPALAGSFKNALGGLMTTPQGREIAVKNLELMGQYQAQIGKIAGDTTKPAQHRMTEIQNLPPPRLQLSLPESGPGASGAAPPAGFKQAKDGGFYAPDPSRPGKFLKWSP
ncbi:hypothetical protein [Methylocapsa palsarum]|uniref:Transglycosylase SLT domain-containing protein n=1 Tax=Methylocapsa palsarum TaxID=1612308 RepID=A0A1I4CGD5_9HYPH|nr:hypothetical protein [Methylocapsa palsarum]SFK79041.1 hypothetical protein SAMN05444581_12112 [Methylocapsa palsarum]